MMDIYGRSPVNKSAAMVTNQSGCSDDVDISLSEIDMLKRRLERKRSLIKHILGIKSKRNHKNVMQRWASHNRRVSGSKNPRILDEYVRSGAAMKKLIDQAAEIKRIDHGKDKS